MQLMTIIKFMKYKYILITKLVKLRFIKLISLIKNNIPITITIL